MQPASLNCFIFDIIMNMFGFGKKNINESNTQNSNDPLQAMTISANDTSSQGAPVSALQDRAPKVDANTEKQKLLSGARDADSLGMLGATFKEEYTAQATNNTDTTNNQNKNNNPAVAVGGNIDSKSVNINSPQILSHTPNTTLNANNKKAATVTMLSAIEQTAGSKEKEKWIKKLEKHRPAPPAPSVKKDSAEAILNSRFTNNQSAQSTVQTSTEATVATKETTPANATASIPGIKKDGTLQDNRSAVQGEIKTKQQVMKRSGTVRTFKSDLQSIMQQDKLSLTKIVAIESDRQKYNPKKNPKKKSDSKYSLMAMIVLFLAIVMTVSLIAYAVYMQSQSEKGGNGGVIDPTKLNALESLHNSLFFVEEKMRIDITRKGRMYVLRVLQAARDSDRVSAGLGNIVEFELVERVPKGYIRTSAEKFLKILYPEVPSTFVDALRPNYALGIFVEDSGRKPFVVFNVDSYQYAFAAMLEWEKDMEKDAGIFLDTYYKGEYDLNYDGKSHFKDAVLKNYDVRVLYNKDGKVRIVYGFVGRDMLIMAGSAKTFLELASRIAVEKGQ